MSFLKRFGFYLIGFSVSLVFVFIIFKNKGTEFCYLPNCRVLKKLRSKTIILMPEVKNKFESDSLAKHHVLWMMREGEIDFPKSHPREKPCREYLVSLENQSLYVKLCDSIVYVQRLTQRVD